MNTDKMIITQLNGGLGNQMFQYAVGRNLAFRHNTQLKLDLSQFESNHLRKYNLYPFNIAENFASQTDLNRVNKPLLWKLQHPLKNFKCLMDREKPIIYIKEKHFNFDPAILNLPDNVYLQGYWQSEQYFKKIGNLIRQEFSFKTVLSPIHQEIRERIAQCNSVSIHVRRGDYIANKVTNEIHGVCTTKYYQRAIKKITQLINNPHFFIFSDDPIWVKENIAIDNPSCCVSHIGSKNHEDLYLMSHCKHHIIANSSFSWWGAWLCTNPKKMIIAPEKWFNTPIISTGDIIPESWIRL
jgi:hypothetical protein